jgi:hypothetical protein
MAHHQGGNVQHRTDEGADVIVYGKITLLFQLREMNFHTPEAEVASGFFYTSPQ